MKNKLRLASTVVVLVATGCGQPQESSLEIVGGSKVAANSIITSHTVALVSPTGKSFCTGTLVSPSHVVTAGHCLAGYDEKALYVAFGPVAKPGYFARERLRWGVTAKVHQGFDLSNAEQFPATKPINDIAMIKLNEPAPKGFTPAPVLTGKDQLKVGETLVLAGFGLTHFLWGSSGVLRQVSTKVESVNRKSKEFDFAASNGRSACSGDSGGPAFVLRGKSLVLVGVTSRGSSRCNSTGTYTDFRPFSPWVNAFLAD